MSATEAAGLAYEPYVLTVTSEGNIPIITLRATGRDPMRAAKVANAGIAAIGELIATRSPGRPNILVERLGPATARTIVTGPRKAIAIARRWWSSPPGATGSCSCRGSRPAVAACAG